MSDNVLSKIRACGANFKNAILRPLAVDGLSKTVEVTVITEKAFTQEDKTKVYNVIRRAVPEYFSLNLQINKLTPDCEMVRRKIFDGVCAYSKAVFATLGESDVCVEKSENGFNYTVAALKGIAPEDLCEKVNAYLKDSFCGEFCGKLVFSEKNIVDIEVEETADEPEFVIPVRMFSINNFEFLEGDKIQKTAVYLADLNLVHGEVVLCGEITELRERSYTNKNGLEKVYYNFTLNDKTASVTVTYFPRLKTLEKIKTLKVGDSIVCTGLNEDFNGNLRYTAKILDRGGVPENFVPEKRVSKPVPLHYKTVRPQPYIDLEQTDIFIEKTVPECLKSETFVVFDLETTGLNSSPVAGTMDKIIEIGAFKIENGEIKESFSTFINPQKKLSEEIISLTGITEEMIKDAPTYEEVMPDFYKFCAGCVLVGHNAANFDFKFIDYYCTALGYIPERKIIDTIPLSQELLFLSNYKLNTIADKFNISFNHHRAIDDALATAKIFIELIRIKKSLPKY